jgi:quercetin dioxygenase-like cupin family protein
MSEIKDHYPKRIQKLKTFFDRFEAFKMESPSCDTLFAMYPAGSVIESHRHDTENCGVVTKGEMILITNGQERRYRVGDWYHLEKNQAHSARFDVDTNQIEFWFKD